jgi:hypothetical protein
VGNDNILLLNPLKHLARFGRPYRTHVVWANAANVILLAVSYATLICLSIPRIGNPYLWSTNGPLMRTIPCPAVPDQTICTNALSVLKQYAASSVITPSRGSLTWLSVSRPFLANFVVLFGLFGCAVCTCPCKVHYSFEAFSRHYTNHFLSLFVVPRLANASSTQSLYRGHPKQRVRTSIFL